MKIIDPPLKSGMQIDLQGECSKTTFINVLVMVAMVTSCLLAPQTPILNSEPTVKSAKCKTPFLKSIDTLRLKA